MTSKNDKVYLKILLQAGNNGKFQRNFNYIFIFLSAVCSTMATYNIVLSLSIPNHWCYVPGRNSTVHNSDQWKNLNIPWKNNSLGQKLYNKCTMYDSNKSITECQFGWEYDKTWYTETIPSKQNWVCENNLQGAHALALARIGEVLGTLIFGTLGDQYGRRPTYFATIILLFSGRLLSTFVTINYWLFVASFILGNLSGLITYQSTLIIAFEISKDERRSFLSFLQGIAWSLGLCLLSIIFWICGSWFYVMLITTCPLIIFLFLGRFMVESPRWLANRGEIKKCHKELQKIAKTNLCNIPWNVMNELETLDGNNAHLQKSTNVLYLFSNLTIASITLILISGWAAFKLIYVSLILNNTNLAGNPFQHLLLQSIAEIPGYLLATFLSQYFGRKLSRMAAFIIVASGCLLLVFFVHDPKYSLAVSIVSCLIKIALAICYYIVNLHCLELFPTNLRQTGISLCTNFAYIAALASPYLVYLGTEIDVRYPYMILAVVAAAGGILTIFLPETKNQPLFDSIDEVSQYVRRQKILSFTRNILTETDVDTELC